MKTFLFQGDSITDAGRVRDSFYDLGNGYPLLFAANYNKNNPETFTFINRGISGNRSVDLYARIKFDLINLKPDYLTILIGVNDVWHELNDKNGVETKKFKKIISMLIEEVKEVLPSIKIIMLEPFVLKGPATEEKWDLFDSGVREKAVAIKEIANEFGLTFVPLQDKFDEAAKKAPATYWLADGVHPAPAGHQIIADAIEEAII